MGSGDRRKINGSGLTSAAAAAPGLSLMISVGLAVTAPGGDSVADVVGPILLLLVIVTVWGFVPALLFGGLVLVALRPSVWMATVPGRVAAGILAAALYVFCSLAIATLLPPLALLLAPWTVLFREEGFAAVGWPILAIVASGAPAGLIYAAFERRG